MVPRHSKRFFKTFFIKTIKLKIDDLLHEEEVQIRWNDKELERIPSSEPFICIVNQLHHPLDDLILIKLLEAGNLRFRLFTPSTGKPIKNYETYYFRSGLDDLPGRSALNLYFSNLQQLLQMAIKEQTSLVIYMDFSSQPFEAIRRNQRHNVLIRAIKKARVPIVPINLSRKSHFSNDFTARIGNPVTRLDQVVFKSSNRFRKFIQAKIFALGSALEVQSFYLQEPPFHQEPEPLADPVTPELIEHDIRNLTFQNLIASRQNFDVFVAKAKDIPHVLTEIGRLREMTFRTVGEGTGHRLDLDEFDLYYKQLIIWDREARRIVGGYRMGEGDKIFNWYGAEGFYISSLFDIKSGFYKIMRQAVELGRSYIIADYQKKRLPLFLLWKGILYFLLQNPQYRYLYGPLSISKNYSSISKNLIVEFIKRSHFDHKLSRYLKPKTPFTPQLDQVNIDILLDNFNGELRNLGNFIEDIEPDHWNIPVLMKQYVKQNAKFISFNIDPNFSDVLDGFIILDLKDVPYATIEALKREN